MTALRVLLAGIVDYAGLFPPSALSMSEAASNYAAYRESDTAWALGRFVVPAARLDELDAVARGLFPRGRGARAWLLSGLAGSELADDVARIGAFNKRHEGGASLGAAVVDTIEIKAANAAEIEQGAGLLPSWLKAYIEIPIENDPADPVATLARIGARAKVRTGGTRAGTFPRPADVTRFIYTCAAAGVPLKATAGLHHALRAEYRLTYAPDSESGPMYGFLNLFLAAAFILSGLENGMAMELLEERCVDAFQFDDRGVAWRGRPLSIDDLRTSRQRLALSFGSCSFREPIDELHSLGLL